MALQRTQPAAVMRRRITTWSLATDVVVSLIVGLIISSLVGWIIFVIGLVVTGVLYYNVTQVARYRR